MAQSESDMMSWIEALNKAVAAALTDLKSSGSTAKELIQRIYEEPSNAFCADCNAPGRRIYLRIPMHLPLLTTMINALDKLSYQRKLFYQLTAKLEILNLSLLC